MPKNSEDKSLLLRLKISKCLFYMVLKTRIKKRKNKKKMIELGRGFLKCRITVADKKGGGFEAYKLSTTSNLVG